MILHLYFLRTDFERRYQKRTVSDLEVLFEESTRLPIPTTVASFCVLKVPSNLLLIRRINSSFTCRGSS